MMLIRKKDGEEKSSGFESEFVEQHWHERWLETGQDRTDEEGRGHGWLPTNPWNELPFFF